mgnify:CR=1 FL=1
MKDSEFIELHNLYLDHEISVADAVRLEAEVQGSPARRRVYREYCQMQKACKLLVTDFQAEAAPANERKVVAFEPASRARRGTAIYVAGACIAAAACVAIIFIGRGRDSGTAGSDARSQQGAHENRAVPAAAAPAPAGAATATGSPRMIAQTVRGPVRRDLAQAAFVGEPRGRSGVAQADALLAASGVQGNAQFEWMRTAQLAPLPQPVPLEELRFEARPVNLRPDGSALGNRPAVPADVESTAFRFVK